MCFKSPKAPAVAPAPSRADVQGEVTDQRKKVAGQQGAFGNIFTSALGDVGYGKSSQPLAALGGATK